METFLVAMEIIALICFSALCAYVIVILSRVSTFLTSVERDIHDLTSRALPVFSNLEAITSRIRTMTEDLEDEVEMVKHSIRAFRGVADSIVEFERRIQRKLEEPVMETVDTVVGAYKGVKAFLRVFGF